MRLYNTEVLGRTASIIDGLSFKISSLFLKIKIGKAQIILLSTNDNFSVRIVYQNRTSGDVDSQTVDVQWSVCFAIKLMPLIFLPIRFYFAREIL